MDFNKPVHTLVLDTGAIIRNDPAVSTLLGQSETLVTVPEIISEIRDAATRSRVETTLMPFLSLRSPSPASVKCVTDFARRTGDLVVLSKPDIHIIALTYEIECERNKGDWRLRKVPGQKGLNGAPPKDSTEEGETSPPEDVKTSDESIEALHSSSESAKSPTVNNKGDDGGHTLPSLERTPEEVHSNSGPRLSAKQDQEAVQDVALSSDAASLSLNESPRASSKDETIKDVAIDVTDIPSQSTTQATSQVPEESTNNTDATVDGGGNITEFQVQDHLANTALANDETSAEEDISPKVDSTQPSPSRQEEEDAESDGGEWITPSNLKQQQAKDAESSTKQAPEPKTMQVAVLTTDFAMQNVILQMNLNLLSRSMTRVKHLKTFVLRCHACFTVSKDMTKQFCPKCGQPTLTRVSCSTNANGEFKLHLKKNIQWNTRGDRYSIPKAVHGAANGRVKGGGKGGWGNDLILTEDQKEFERANKVESRQKERSLMDEDYLPSILTGDRGRTGGRIKVGAGRHINSKKR